MKHYPFPKIRQYHQVLRDMKLHHSYVGKDEQGEPIYDNTIELPTITFQGHVKLHGTNAAIVFDSDGTTYAQSRKNIINEIKDNAGFAHWVAKEGHKLRAKITFAPGMKAVVYGEWCGGSIQKGVALNDLPKMFVVFGLKIINDADESQWQDSSHIQDESINVHHISRAPAFSISIDLNRPEKAIGQMTAWVDEIDADCPFAKTFGVEGHGEGIVFRPFGEHDFDCAFKVKGEAHTKSKIKKLPTVDVVKMDGIQQTVETHCHEDRLEQGWSVVIKSEADEVPQKIAEFIQWVVNDLWEEEGDSIRASDISRKDIGCAVSKKAARWFQTKLQQLSKTKHLDDQITQALGPIFRNTPDYKTITEAIALTLARVSQSTPNKGKEYQEYHELDSIMTMASEALTQFLNEEEAQLEAKQSMISKGIEAMAEMARSDDDWDQWGDGGPMAAKHLDDFKPFHDENGKLTQEGFEQLKKDVIALHTPDKEIWSNSPIHEEIARFERENQDLRPNCCDSSYNPDGPRAYAP